jgi:hypothetical protein
MKFAVNYKLIKSVCLINSIVEKTIIWLPERKEKKNFFGRIITKYKPENFYHRGDYHFPFYNNGNCTIDNDKNIIIKPKLVIVYKDNTISELFFETNEDAEKAYKHLMNDDIISIDCNF